MTKKKVIIRDVARRASIIAMMPPAAQIHHVEVNEKIGRISIDGQVGNKPAAVVFMASDMPADLADEEINGFMLDKLRQSVKEDK